MWAPGVIVIISRQPGSHGGACAVIYGIPPVMNDVVTKETWCG